MSRFVKRLLMSPMPVQKNLALAPIAPILTVGNAVEEAPIAK